MTDKELRRMSRADLVEIIYEVRKNEAELQKEVEDLKKQLEEKQKKVSKAGSLAELSAGINGLFESAQATADQYLQEISNIYEHARKLQSDTERRASAIAKQALKERAELLKQTEEECRRMKEAAGIRRPAPKQTIRETAPQEAGSVYEEPVSFQQNADDMAATREMPLRKTSGEAAPRKRSQTAQRKSARPVTMNDRRKMQ